MLVTLLHKIIYPNIADIQMWFSSILIMFLFTVISLGLIQHFGLLIYKLIYLVNNKKTRTLGNKLISAKCAVNVIGFCIILRQGQSPNFIIIREISYRNLIF